MVQTVTPCLDPRLARILAYIDRHYADPLTLDKLAKEAGISKYHFVKLFRQVAGQTPIAYVANVRLERARHLLCTTEMSVSEVASTCGYARATHFSAAFSGRYGISPSKMRAVPLK